MSENQSHFLLERRDNQDVYSFYKITDIDLPLKVRM